MTISKVCVCGAGTMGSGIALACSQSGFHVILYELNLSVLESARKGIGQTLSTLVSKGKLSEADASAIRARISFTGEIDNCRADICIEAIVERIDAKISLFQQLAAINPGDTIFATNTSSLPVKEIARGISSPNRLVGMHFFNPATIMKLVEIVETPQTDEKVKDLVIDFSKKLGKVPVLCSDSPGFIVNRVARPFYIEALRQVERTGVSFEMVDRALEGAGFRMGPFRLMDLIGNDVNHAVSCSVYEQLGQPSRLKPSAIQERQVKSGKLGRKSGEGYYSYAK